MLKVETRFMIKDLYRRGVTISEIVRAFGETKRDLGVPKDRDWLNGYYQFCNRIAALYFLNAYGVPARLLNLYFLGDRQPDRTCPRDEEGWQEALQAQAEHVGLPAGHRLEARMHELFLPMVL